MTGPGKYPYVTRMEARYGPLEVVDVQAVVDECSDAWYNETLCAVNDALVRVGILQGEYHWHSHTEEDEFFVVVEGRLLIDLDDREIALNPRQGFLVPRGVRHRTRAPERCVVLMIEANTVEPTGS